MSKFYRVKKKNMIVHNPTENDSEWAGVYGKEYVGGELFPHEGICDRSFHLLVPFLDLHINDPTIATIESEPITAIDAVVGGDADPDPDNEWVSDESGAIGILDTSESD